MQIYLLKKGVCPFTPPIDQYWHSFTRGIDNAINNQKIIGICFQINNVMTIPWSGSTTCNETKWLLTKRDHENFNLV